MRLLICFNIFDNVLYVQSVVKHIVTWNSISSNFIWFLVKKKKLLFSFITKDKSSWTINSDFLFIISCEKKMLMLTVMKLRFCSSGVFSTCWYDLSWCFQRQLSLYHGLQEWWLLLEQPKDLPFSTMLKGL